MRIRTSWNKFRYSWSFGFEVYRGAGFLFFRLCLVKGSWCVTIYDKGHPQNG